MKTINFISKVTPYNIPKTKINNLTKEKNPRLAPQIKYVIILELIFGFNRIYLLQPRNITEILSYGYSVTFSLIVVYYYVSYANEISAFMKLIKYGFLFAYLLRMFCMFSLTFGRRQFMKLFEIMENVDVLLNIVNKVNVTTFVGKTLFLVLSVSTNILQYYLLSVSHSSSVDSINLARIYVPTAILHAVSDMEQVFYCYLLKFIYMRLVIVMAHVEKLNAVSNNMNIKNNNLEKLAEHTYLDIETLRIVYVKLQECAGIINLVMGIPMLLTFISSGINTIMLLKEAVIMAQDHTTPGVKYGILYIVIRCVKSTLLLIVPCYYSSQTVTQVVKLRTAVHDALLTAVTDKEERRTMKCFHHLTKESSFEYVLCGLIDLNMGLPFSYFNLCTTYLIIVIQFSKLFD